MDFGRQNGAKLAPKTHQKSFSTSEGPFYKKCCKTNEVECFFGCRGPKLGPKIDQKSIKKRKQKGKPFEHRFFINFGGFWGASLEAKCAQEGPKRVRKSIDFLHPQKGRLRVAWRIGPEAAGAVLGGSF